MSKKFVFLTVVLSTLGIASVGWAQTPVQLKYTRVVDLTLPIESNMEGIPGLKSYAENPSRVTVIAAITDAQRELLRAEGMTLSNNLVVNGRSMISVLSILVHNGTHIDAPRHMVDKGEPVDQVPLERVAKEVLGETEQFEARSSRDRDDCPNRSAAVCSTRSIGSKT